MNWTATDFVEHPEGGRFREVFRSDMRVQRDGYPDRSACTHIYFQLRTGEVSRFHRVQQEEVWNLYQGSLKLWIYVEETDTLTEQVLSAEANCFCTVVPSGAWQACEPLTEEVLVGCTVAPGFDFADFELVSTTHTAHRMLSAHGLSRFL